jgi:hypothetical protein
MEKINRPGFVSLIPGVRILDRNEGRKEGEWNQEGSNMNGTHTHATAGM